MATVGYRSIVTKPVLVWTAAALANKLPIAMAPLAFVFLAREMPGGYALGATLAALWVVSEVVGAPLLGVWFNPERARLHLAFGLGAGALAYGALSLGETLPAPALFVLTFLSGFGPAASPGGLRAILTRLVPEEDVSKVLSAEVSLNGLVWAMAPVVVAFVATGVSPGTPMAVAAALDVVAVAVVVFFLPEGRTEEAPPGGTTSTKVLASAWPSYLTAAASMAMVAIVELVLPALVESKGIEVRAVAPLLATFWVAGVLGGYLYGRRTWPASRRVQAFVSLLVTTTALTLVAVAPGAVGIGIALAVGGMFQSAVLVTRNLSLRDALPASAHTAGYALMYATTGVGYSIVAATSALVMTYTSPGVAILGGGAITLVLGVVATVSEGRRPKRS
ncbi:hypothetical protein UK23_32300 [Lentzea aerocolonigenes]|uniref:MFS transporter n=1 Tax=Lentzea aerocolonigenes TaxID=68170 RepID=A0A0F0GJC3_LENAE|nr:MFS transporter [Lentzea aerocolonigenes]KJK43659.1 hypothetical protein UK23_32300 [Lentzea aerocolonigenes]